MAILLHSLSLPFVKLSLLLLSAWPSGGGERREPLEKPFPFFGE